MNNPEPNPYPELLRRQALEMAANAHNKETGLLAAENLREAFQAATDLATKATPVEPIDLHKLFNAQLGLTQAFRLVDHDKLEHRLRPLERSHVEVARRHPEFSRLVSSGSGFLRRGQTLELGLTEKSAARISLAPIMDVVLAASEKPYRLNSLESDGRHVVELIVNEVQRGGEVFIAQTLFTGPDIALALEMSYALLGWSHGSPVRVCWSLLEVSS